MEAIIFCGIQAAGKSTFYRERFFKSHLRISLDMLKTRHREHLIFNACLEAKQSLVVDNTNPTIADRAKYISAAKTHKFKVIGYFFETDLAAALARNAARLGKENIPVVGVKGTYNKLEIPTLEEGFDELYFVKIVDNQFEIQQIMP